VNMMVNYLTNRVSDPIQDEQTGGFQESKENVDEQTSNRDGGSEGKAVREFEGS
jgi:hypothetical protein